MKRVLSAPMTGRFYRVKEGQTAAIIERELKMPVKEAFAGEIIEVVKCKVVLARPFDTYASIAAEHGADAASLEEFNFSRPLYPTAAVYIPE